MGLLEDAPAGAGVEERSCLGLAEEHTFTARGSSYSVITKVILTGLGCYKGNTDKLDRKIKQKQISK